MYNLRDKYVASDECGAVQPDYDSDDSWFGKLLFVMSMSIALPVFAVLLYYIL